MYQKFKLVQEKNSRCNKLHNLKKEQLTKDKKIDNTNSVLTCKTTGADTTKSAIKPPPFDVTQTPMGFRSFLTAVKDFRWVVA